jgi:hypothetical protein
MNMVLKALFVDVRKSFMHFAMVSQRGRDINPGVDEGDFITGQSMGPPTSLLVCCIFIQYVILPDCAARSRLTWFVCIV